jgi:hypothetical protein
LNRNNSIPTKQGLPQQSAHHLGRYQMVQPALQYCYSPRLLRQVFGEHAERQGEGELSYSTLVDLLSLVVLKKHPTLHAASYRRSALGCQTDHWRWAEEKPP